MAGVYGNAANKVGLNIAVVFVIMLGLPGQIDTAAARFAAFLAGGLWATALSLWLWPTHPYQPVREAIAAYYRALGTFFIGAVRAGDGRDDASPGGTTATAKERAAVVDAASRARDALLSVRACLQGATPEAERLMLLALDADNLADVAVALAEEIETAARVPQYAAVRSIVETAVRHLSEATEGIAAALLPGRGAPDLTGLDASVKTLSERVTELRAGSRDLAADDPGIVALRSLARGRARCRWRPRIRRRRAAVQRVAGTLLGGILAAILVQLIRNDAVIDILLALLGIAAFSQTQGVYGLFVLLLTPFVVLMIESVQPGGLASGADLPLAAVRVLNTGLGGALALLAGTLFWPSWERERLPEQLARTIDANREYFHELLAIYFGRPMDAAAIRRAREQAQVENANAAAAFQRLLSEPSTRRGAVEPIYALVTYNQRFYDGVTTLAASLPTFSGWHSLPGLERLVEQIECLLAGVSEAVRSGRLPEPAAPERSGGRAFSDPLSALEESIQALQAAMQELSAARVAELKEHRTDSPKREAILEFAPVTAELVRLARDVAGMYHTLARMEQGSLEMERGEDPGRPTGPGAKRHGSD